MLALPAEPAAAQVCNAPSQRSSIRAAVLEPACAVVNVAFGGYVESVAVHRSVWIHGASTATTLIRGRVLVRGAGTAETPPIIGTALESSDGSREAILAFVSP